MYILIVLLGHNFQLIFTKHWVYVLFYSISIRIIAVLRVNRRDINYLPPRYRALSIGKAEVAWCSRFGKEIKKNRCI